MSINICRKVREKWALLREKGFAVDWVLTGRIVALADSETMKQTFTQAVRGFNRNCPGTR